MTFDLFRKIMAVIYTLLIIGFVCMGFAYSNQVNTEYRENTVYLNENWIDHGQVVNLPFKRDDRQINMTNTLPVVYGDQLLVVKVYYYDYQILIDGEVVQESKDSKFLGRTTVVGNKEIWVNLDPEYSGKEITVKASIQKALYRPWVTEAFISTRSAYAINLLRANVAATIIFVIFTILGIIQIIVSSVFIIRKVALIRKLTFQALFYAGCFSFVTAQWVLNETRLPVVIWGNKTAYGIITIVSFLLMPLLFFEITRSLFLRVRKIDNIVDTTLAFSILLSFLPIFFGLYDWGHLIYVAHALDISVLILVAYYSLTGLREEKEISLKAGIAIANIVFLILAVFAAINYINNSSTDYILIFLLDLFLYILAQIALIYRRIELNVKEEKEFAKTKVYAYTDELTGLGNRRKFYNAIDEYEKEGIPENLCYIAIDVNRLKYYNDTSGHEAGDELLRGTAECIKRAFNIPGTVVGRMGGDEFAILVAAPKETIDSCIDSMINYMASWNGEFVKGIAVAYGVAFIAEEDIDCIDSMAKKADERMYADKRSFYEKTGIDRRSSN